MLPGRKCPNIVGKFHALGNFREPPAATLQTLPPHKAAPLQAVRRGNRNREPEHEHEHEHEHEKKDGLLKEKWPRTQEKRRNL